MFVALLVGGVAVDVELSNSVGVERVVVVIFSVVLIVVVIVGGGEGVGVDESRSVELLIGVVLSGGSSVVVFVAVVRGLVCGSITILGCVTIAVLGLLVLVVVIHELVSFQSGVLGEF